jgi:hypothetical protein
MGPHAATPLLGARQWLDFDGEAADPRHEGVAIPPLEVEVTA